MCYSVGCYLFFRLWIGFRLFLGEDCGEGLVPVYLGISYRVLLALKIPFPVGELPSIGFIGPYGKLRTFRDLIGFIVGFPPDRPTAFYATVEGNMLRLVIVFLVVPLVVGFVVGLISGFSILSIRARRTVRPIRSVFAVLLIFSFGSIFTVCARLAILSIIGFFIIIPLFIIFGIGAVIILIRFLHKHGSDLHSLIDHQSNRFGFTGMISFPVGKLPPVCRIGGQLHLGTLLVFGFAGSGFLYHFFPNPTVALYLCIQLVSLLGKNGGNGHILFPNNPCRIVGITVQISTPPDEHEPVSSNRFNGGFHLFVVLPTGWVDGTAFSGSSGGGQYEHIWLIGGVVDSGVVTRSKNQCNTA